jgi:UDP-GlcNAc:undecaprenyl-phosphate GlcNAc-1-phosphate transferase
VGAGFMALVGLWDDRYVLGIRAKFLAEVAAACLLIAAGVQIRLFNTPLIDFPLTILWVAAVTNAVNFLDNMDGLAAGLSGIAAGFFTIIAFTEGLTLVSALAAALCGSAVGFLIYNFSPASTFMGDMGALLLGFILAVLGIKIEFGTQPLSVTWMVPLFVLALPLFDIALVVVTRIGEGRSPGQAGKDHTSHRLISLGLNHRWTLLTLYGVCVLAGVNALFISVAPPDQAFAAGMVGFALLGALFIAMMMVRRRFQPRHDSSSAAAASSSSTK